MTQTAGNTKIKNGEEKNKEYSIEWFGKNCTIKYKWKIKDRRILKWMPFINILGGNAVRITAWSSVIIGIFGIAVIPESLPEDWHILLPAYIISFCIFCYGAFLFSYRTYLRATKCKKCHKAYAYEETENPDVKEVSTEDTYTVTVTRYWKCKYCGYVESTESSENILTRKGKVKKPRTIICEKCGKSGIYPEYKTPDVKNEDKAFTSIRYYKCEHCKYINLEVEKTSSSEGSTWESCGSDPRL